MAWFSKAFGGEVKRHEKKLWAISECNFAAHGGASVTDLGVYKRDPSKYPDEPNLLPALIAKAQVKRTGDQIRQIMGRKRAR